MVSLAREAAMHLHGLHDVLCQIAFSNQLQGGHNRRHLAFLADAALNISKALENAHESASEAECAADEADLRDREAAKRAKRGHARKAKGAA